MVKCREREFSPQKSLLVLLKLGEKPIPPASSFSLKLRFSTREGRITRLSSTTPIFKGRFFGVGGEVLGLALFISTLLFSTSVRATPQSFTYRLDPPQPSSLKFRLKRGENQVLVPLLKGDLGGSLWGESVLEAGRSSLSIAQQPTTNQQDPTRAAAEQVFEEGQQLRKQGTVESLRQAIAKYEEALSLYRAVGDRQFEAVTLNNIGYIYSALGEKQKALDFYNQSLPLSQATGNKALQAITLNNIGLVYDDLGEKQKALDYYQQSFSVPAKPD